MPSTPRLSTPARSATSSPAAASRSGVEAASTARMMASARPISRSHQTLPSDVSLRSLAVRWQEPDAVDDERIAAQHIEQQDALEHLGQVERDLHGDLRLLATNEGERQEQAGDQYPDRVQAAEERDDDRSEAIARRDAGLQVADRARDLDDAGKP